MTRGRHGGADAGQATARDQQIAVDLDLGHVRLGGRHAPRRVRRRDLVEGARQFAAGRGSLGGKLAGEHDQRVAAQPDIGKKFAAVHLDHDSTPLSRPRRARILVLMNRGKVMGPCGLLKGKEEKK